MVSIQQISDKLSIGLSLACAIHCMFTPVLLVWAPSLLALNLDNEVFHLAMLIAVVPISLFALGLGCKQHKQYRFFSFGILGLALMILAAALGEQRITEMGEKLLTLGGASLVAVGHWFNYRRCSAVAKSNCDCSGARAKA